MIVLQLRDWRRYQELANLQGAFAFLEQRAAGLAEGRHEISGDQVYALMITHQPKPVTECRFETHQRYADVVYLVSGSEMIGYAPADSLEAEGEYDAEKDLAFHLQPEFFTPVLLKAGMVAVFYPEDGHMPGCIYARGEEVKKVVAKVKVV
jgi:biofilm protein TabA